MTSATRTANTHVCALSASVYSDVVTCIQSPRKGNSSGKHEHCQYDATGTNVQFDALCYSHSNNTNTTMQKTLCCQWLQRNWTLVEFVIAVSWQWLWQHGEASVETLHVREDAFPVGHFHTNHVVDLEQRNDLGTFPAEKNTHFIIVQSIPDKRQSQPLKSSVHQNCQSIQFSSSLGQWRRHPSHPMVLIIIIIIIIIILFIKQSWQNAAMIT